MGTSFDKILIKGKHAANKHNPEDVWKSLIGLVLYDLHRVNELYGKDSSHHIAIKQIKCEKCDTATFLALVRDLDEKQRAIKFHLGNWQAISEDSYLCPNCKR